MPTQKHRVAIESQNLHVHRLELVTAFKLGLGLGLGFLVTALVLVGAAMIAFNLLGSVL